MDKINEFITGLGKKLEDLSAPNIDTIINDTSFNYVPPPTIIDKKHTLEYQLQNQTNQINEKANEQIKLLSEQNQQLNNNYQKLEDLYKIKEQEVLEAKKEAKMAKILNIVMLVIAIVSMLVAIAAWFYPNILGGAAK